MPADASDADEILISFPEDRESAE